MTKPSWPRFMRRKKEDGTYEERQFPSAESVPADQGWEMITPPAAIAPAPDLHAAAAQATAEAARLSRQVADLIPYVGALEQFASDMAEIEEAPEAVKERVAALLASSPLRPAAEAAPAKNGKGKK